MISARWVITAALMLGVAAVAIGYARYFRGHAPPPVARSLQPVPVSPRVNHSGCDPDRVVVDESGPEVRAIETQLYELVVQSKYPRKFPMVVESTSVPVPLHTPGAEGAEFFDKLPRELASWVASRGRAIDCSEQTLDRFPPETILVPEERIIRTARFQRTPVIDWERFQERFPETKAIFGFSRAKLTSDGHDALVYYERFCPNNCGEGEYVWFHRAAATSEWRIAKKQITWVS